MKVENVTLEKKYHSAVEHWRRHHFKDYETLLDNWEKYFPKDEKFCLCAKMEIGTSDVIQVGDQKGEKKRLDPDQLTEDQARHLLAIIKAQTSVGLGADAYIRRLIDSGERIMGFGHRVYRAQDPRARVLRRTAQELGSRRVAVAEALETAALNALRERSPDRVLETNVEFWAAVVLDIAEIPLDMYPAMFGCARVAGWSAHILEEKKTGRLIRPAARYIGPGPRPISAL